MEDILAFYGSRACQGFEKKEKKELWWVGEIGVICARTIDSLILTEGGLKNYIVQMLAHDL